MHIVLENIALMLNKDEAENYLDLSDKATQSQLKLQIIECEEDCRVFLCCHKLYSISYCVTNSLSVGNRIKINMTKW